MTMPRKKQPSKAAATRKKQSGTQASSEAAHKPSSPSSRQTVLPFQAASSPALSLNGATTPPAGDVTPGSTSPDSSFSFAKEDEAIPRGKEEDEEESAAASLKPPSPMKRERGEEVCEKPPSPNKRERGEELPFYLVKSETDVEVSEKKSDVGEPVASPPEKEGTKRQSQGTLDDFFGCRPRPEEVQKRGRGRVRRSKSAVAGAARKAQDGLEAFNLDRHFPIVRRSSRRDEKMLKEMTALEVERRVVNNIEEGLKVVDFEDKGRGVVVTRRFEADEFVVEYAGNLVTDAEAKKLNTLYSADPNVGCYMFWIVNKGRKLCVDATAESGRFGRLINHSRTGANLKPKVMEFLGKPRLLLFATRQIFPGEELMYDYGDRDKQSMQEFPWLKT